MQILRRHWREYSIEALLLGTFMISACAVRILLAHPSSPIHQLLPDPFFRRALTGIAMGATATCLVYSPLGRRSGAHMNPAMTLTFLRLGKIDRRDATAYVMSQFAGGILGILAVRIFCGMLASDPAVRFATTMPGASGTATAFFAEVAISFVLMMVILVTSNSASLSRYTGVFCGLLLANYITFESPISGMSMNPARSFASAFGSREFHALWIYFVAPPLGMFAAGEVYLRVRGAHRILCAKLFHGSGPCIFHCNYSALAKAKS